MNDETKLNKYTRNEIMSEVTSRLQDHTFRVLPASNAHATHKKDFKILVQVPGGLVEKTICQERTWRSIKTGITNMLLAGTLRTCQICNTETIQFIGCSECGNEFCSMCHRNCLIRVKNYMTCKCPFCRDIA